MYYFRSTKRVEDENYEDIISGKTPATSACVLGYIYLALGETCGPATYVALERLYDEVHVQGYLCPHKMARELSQEKIIEFFHQAAARESGS